MTPFLFQIPRRSYLFLEGVTLHLVASRTCQIQEATRATFLDVLSSSVDTPGSGLNVFFSNLQQKMRMEDVSENWSRVLASNTIWSDFVVNDKSFTKSQYNYAGKFYEVYGSFCLHS